MLASCYWTLFQNKTQLFIGCNDFRRKGGKHETGALAGGNKGISRKLQKYFNIFGKQNVFIKVNM
jgi:hypothetical protein